LKLSCQSCEKAKAIHYFDGGLFPRLPPDGWPVLLGQLGLPPRPFPLLPLVPFPPLPPLLIIYSFAYQPLNSELLVPKFLVQSSLLYQMLAELKKWDKRGNLRETNLSCQW
jgi:hypothetical protein